MTACHILILLSGSVSIESQVTQGMTIAGSQNKDLSKKEARQGSYLHICDPTFTHDVRDKLVTK
jgi:hypothetical protein